MNLLALVLQDTTEQQQAAARAMAGLGVGFFLFFFVFAIAIMAFFIWMLWRIFTKAGMSGALSLLVLVPGVGGIIALCILAFGTWKVVPAPVAYVPGLPPNYPPQAPLPPTNYPSQY